MKTFIVGSGLMVTLALAASFSYAQELAPDILLNSVAIEVIAIIKKDNDAQTGNSLKVAELVETKILPLFDFPRMTRIVMARNWQVASPQQQQTLTREFETLLVHTYSTVLSSYRDQSIEFAPLNMAPGDKEVTVKSVVNQPGTAQMSIDYHMVKGITGWKVVDITIGGVSVVSIYRQMFAEKVRNDGVEGLIKLLDDKNQQGKS